MYALRPRPHVTVFVWKRNFFFADWPLVHSYPVKTVNENATFRKRSPEWKFLKTPFLCIRVDAENGTFRKRWRHSVGSSLPRDKAAPKINLNAKWRRILCYKKIQNIGDFCLAWIAIDIFRGLRDFTFVCNFKKQLHFVICPNKRVSLALAPRSTWFLSWLRHL